MKPRTTTPRRLLALSIATLLVAVSVAVPVLDAGRAVSSLVLESEHHASSCLTGHDHTVCTQVGSNLPLAPAHAVSDVWGGDSRKLGATSLVSLEDRSPDGSSRARAPPRTRT